MSACFLSGMAGFPQRRAAKAFSKRHAIIKISADPLRIRQTAVAAPENAGRIIVYLRNFVAKSP